jgi:hypothetical protein
MSMTTARIDFALSSLSSAVGLQYADSIVMSMLQSMSKKVQLCYYIEYMAANETDIRRSDSVTPNDQAGAHDT